MERILIVSSTEKGKIYGNELRKIDSSCQITTASNGSEARRLLIETIEFDFILINAPLTDEFGYDFALSAVQAVSAGILLLVKSKLADEVASKVEEVGIFVLSKPVNRTLFYQAVKMVSASHKRLLKLKRENSRLEQKIKEIRLVDRAKCILIQHFNMTEPQAHHYIEKQAMDMRCSKREIAEGLLQIYEI